MNQKIQQDIKISRNLNHPNIINLLELFENEQQIIIIYDYFSGKDLYSALLENYFKDQSYILDGMHNLLQALTHIHDKNIFHRDIRLENIVFKQENLHKYKLAIINFQIADFICASSINKKNGSIGYIAPEFFNLQQFDEKVDIFSMGIVFYSLFHKYLPFQANDADEVLQLNKKCEISFNLVQNQKISINILDLLKSMLEKDPSKRKNAKYLSNHAIFVDIKQKAVSKNKVTGINNALETIQEVSSDLDKSQNVSVSSFCNEKNVFQINNEQDEEDEHDDLKIEIMENNDPQNQQIQEKQPQKKQQSDFINENQNM